MATSRDDKAKLDAIYRHGLTNAQRKKVDAETSGGDEQEGDDE